MKSGNGRAMPHIRPLVSTISLPSTISMSPSAAPFFSDSPNARSKSITAADLDTYGVQYSFDTPLLGYLSFVIDS